jgi:hypothetical protein
MKFPANHMLASGLRTSVHCFEKCLAHPAIVQIS